MDQALRGVRGRHASNLLSSTTTNVYSNATATARRSKPASTDRPMRKDIINSPVFR